MTLKENCKKYNSDTYLCGFKNCYIFVLFILILFTIGMISGCSNSSSPAIGDRFFKGDLFFLKTQRLGEESILVFTITPSMSVKNATMSFLLPSSIELVNKEDKLIDFYDVIFVNESIKKTINVKMIMKGNWDIQASVKGFINDNEIQEIYPLFVSISSEGVKTNSQKPYYPLSGFDFSKMVATKKHQ